VRIKWVRLVDEGWELQGTNDGIYSGASLLMTPPMPQTLELLSHVKLSEHDMNILQGISFGPCMAAMIEIDGETNLPEPGGLQDFQKDIYWIADNKSKGISGKRILTLHAGTTYTEQRWEEDDETVLADMVKSLDGILAKDTTIGEMQLKRWRYSVPLTTHTADTLIAENLSYPLAFAGDAFGGRGRVEGAFMSGYAAGHALAEALGK